MNEAVLEGKEFGVVVFGVARFLVDGCVLHLFTTLHPDELFPVVNEGVQAQRWLLHDHQEAGLLRFDLFLRDSQTQKLVDHGGGEFGVDLAESRCANDWHDVDHAVDTDQAALSLVELELYRLYQPKFVLLSGSRKACVLLDVAVVENAALLDR